MLLKLKWWFGDSNLSCLDKKFLNANQTGQFLKRLEGVNFELTCLGGPMFKIRGQT